MKLLLIGSLPPPIGGTTVLFQQLTDELKACPDICLHIVNTSRSRSTCINNVLVALGTVLRMIRQVPFADIVSFHTSVSGALKFGPVVHVLCRLFKTKWIFRGFGGDYDAWHQEASPIARLVFSASVLRADMLLFERQTSVRYFQHITDRPVHWYANSRKWDSTASPALSQTLAPARRFVYVGHIKKEKGIEEIIKASRLLRSAAVIDIYGPLDGTIPANALTSERVHYKGPLAPECVIPTLRQYDALLLPTYWKGEGYPGVILEAYCAGIPVIASRWGGIPEIVSERSGILIEPRNSQALADAMQTLTTSSDRLRELQHGAAAMAQQFSSSRWTQTFLDMHRQLLAA